MRLKRDRRNVNLNDEPSYLTRFNRLPADRKDKVIPVIMVICLGGSIILATVIGLMI